MILSVIVAFFIMSINFFFSVFLSFFQVFMLSSFCECFEVPRYKRFPFVFIFYFMYMHTWHYLVLVLWFSFMMYGISVYCSTSNHMLYFSLNSEPIPAGQPTTDQVSK